MSIFSNKALLPQLSGLWLTIRTQSEHPDGVKHYIINISPSLNSIFPTQIASSLEQQWPVKPQPLWHGADTINRQRAQLAVSNLKGIYTQALLQPSDPCQTTSSAAAAPTASGSSTSSLPKPTALIKDPNVIQPPNQYCQILKLQGTKENNIKAEKLQLYVCSQQTFN